MPTRGAEPPCAKIIECWRLALDPLRHPKTGMGPLWEVWGFEISTRNLNFELLFLVWAPFLEVKQYQSVNIREIIQNTQ